MIPLAAHTMVSMSTPTHRFSRRLTRASLLVACFGTLGGWASADDLALNDGSILTGVVRSINEAGAVELASDLAPQPVQLQPDAIASIQFTPNGGAPPPQPTAMIEMLNGDRLPAEIEALDGRQLTVISPVAGRLVIPREALKSLQLGIRRHPLVFAGPTTLDEWTHNPHDTHHWGFDHNSLIATGQASASKIIPALPPQFSLRLTLKWQPKQVPNFQLSFADPLQLQGDNCDRYYLQFGEAGVEIKREASHGRRFTTLVQLNRHPNQYPDHQLQVDLRVDRKNSRLQLLLNGELEGEFADPIPAPPTGSGIALLSNAPNGNTLEIRDIEILELDEARSRDHATERGDPQSDSLLSRQGDRWDGHLTDIQKTSSGPLLHITTGAHAEQLEIPATEVASVFFATLSPAPPAPAPQPLVLRLSGDGMVHATSCQFQGEMVTASHPLLGILSLCRNGVWSLDWPAAKPSTADTSSVRFSNHNQITGTLDQLTPELLVWKSAALAVPTAFFLKQVVDITQPPAPMERAADGEATLKLTNGDTVCGQLVAITPLLVTLETSFAGRMDFRRVMVAGAKIAAPSTLLYRGPSVSDEWQQGSATRPSWRFIRSALVAQAPGYIARDQILPDSCALTFDVAWLGDALGLKVFVLSREVSTDSPSGYELTFQRGSISLRNVRTQSFLGSTRALALLENESAHIEIRASATSGKVCLWVNDRLLESWTDPEVSKDELGAGLRFEALSPSPLRISAIAVEPWDGAVEPVPPPQLDLLHQFDPPGVGLPTKPGAPSAYQPGRMELTNGDRLSGEVIAIAEGQVAIKTPLGTLQVPLSRLRNVAVQSSDPERCKRRNGDIRAWLSNGSSIVFQLNGLHDSSLLGSSQNFGSAAIKLADCSRLEFNIHDPALEDQRHRREW